jgi:DeoR family transcriptional regulator, aga operon transcriptional repressor
LSRYERWNGLLSLLAGRGRLSVEEAATELSVSAATIRRDFDQLAQQQMLTRTRGGAVAHTVTYDLPLRYKSARRASEKQRIASVAADLVQPGAVVGINGGTTTTEVARALATRADLHADNGSHTVTVVTNALNIAGELVVRPHIKIVLTGGVALPQSYELVGPLANGVFDQVTLDMAFLGVSGLDIERGATCANEDEASINRQMAVRAERVVVVADGSKLGERAFAKICAIGEVDMLVTDAEADTDAYEEAGIKVIRA